MCARFLNDATGSALSREMASLSTRKAGRRPSGATVDLARILSCSPFVPKRIKDNHARNALKYVVMMLPEPTEKTRQEKNAEKLEAYRMNILFDDAVPGLA